VLIGEDWMVNLMTIYIKKIIARALDFNDIIKLFNGHVSLMSPNLSLNYQIRPPIEI
jgi:hypothetical protein